ncbi:MAG: DUF4424 domain-containing protein [Hyphomicrobiaceae bacterium]|nr:DUF4424 domain-containing protein [Hyphomicrobiaceae bacterium]
MISALEVVPWRARFNQATAVVVLLAGVNLLACRGTAASDLTGELATGGLVLTRRADIEMRAEDVYVSPGQIRVEYRFYNAASADVTMSVAFPMPDVTVADAAARVPLPSDDPQNLLGFSTLVDGAPVKAWAVQKAFAQGVDRTADLERLKVPLAPHLRSTDQALSKLRPGDSDELRRLGLAGAEEYRVGGGMRKQLSPRWTLKTTYLWDQTFPAGREVAVEHSYMPSVGRSTVSPLRNPDAMRPAVLQDYMRKYCIDQDFIAAIERARQSTRRQDGAPFSEERISYLLATGPDGARPIGEFRLVVDKGDPGNLVSFCADGAIKVGPTQIEVRKTAFVPRQDLHVLILKRQGRS